MYIRPAHGCCLSLTFQYMGEIRATTPDSCWTQFYRMSLRIFCLTVSICYNKLLFSLFESYFKLQLTKLWCYSYTDNTHGFRCCLFFTVELLILQGHKYLCDFGNKQKSHIQKLVKTSIKSRLCMYSGTPQNRNLSKPEFPRNRTIG